MENNPMLSILSKNKKKTKEVEQPDIIPQWPLVYPPAEIPPVPADLTFEKVPGTLLKENGILFMDKEFNQENCMPLVKMIMEYNMMPAEKAPDIIHLYINSPGGLVASAFHLIDVIKTSRIPVYTYGMGMIASCGVLLMMSGTKGHRYLTQNTAVMSHQYASGAGGKEHELYASLKSFELTSERMVEHYVKNTGKNETYVRKHLLPESDVWMDAADAVKHGIADIVVQTY
jgi:ATP-dependent Clp protease, protease subunit